MNGKAIAGGLVGVALIVGGGLWYSIERAYYTTVTDVTEVMGLPVTNYHGIDADTSPLKMRACFKVDWDYVPSQEFKDIATPLRAPRFFNCFDAGMLTTDLQAGDATVILADENHPYGFDTFIAQYPDGRAFMWRQINACGEAWFSGDDMPEGCPEPKTIIIEETDDTIILMEGKISEPVMMIPSAIVRFVQGHIVQEVKNHG